MTKLSISNKPTRIEINNNEKLIKIFSSPISINIKYPGIQGPAGSPGSKGETGNSGPAGPMGPQGLPGTNGINGTNGIDGINGAVGPQGQTGATGPKGDTGNQGPQGPIGLTGPKGDTGNAGVNGTNGVNGLSAFQIAQANGFTGTIGAWLASLKGDTGSQGLQGIQGIKGDKGDTGAKGDTGLQGIQGVKGDKGDNATGNMLSSVYDPTGKATDAFNAENLADGTTKKVMTASERIKLGNIAEGATANSPDATLLARANQTGTQAIGTVSGLQAALDAKIAKAGATDLTANFRTSGEWQSSGSSYRLVGGNYGAFLRNDGTNLFLMLTASGDQYGTWNALRPFMIDLASGLVTLGNGLSVLGGSASVYAPDGTSLASLIFRNVDGTERARVYGSGASNLTMRWGGTTWSATFNGSDGTLTLPGALVLPGDPTINLHAATKQYVDTKAPLASPALTGTPTAPTAASGTNTTQLATTAFVLAAIAALVGSAPATLDTLQEIAAQLASDESVASALATTVAGKLSKAGDTMTGLLTLSGNPTANLHSVTKQYSDGRIVFGSTSSGSYIRDTITGYQRCWGAVTTPNGSVSAGAAASITVTFPSAFVDDNIIMQATAQTGTNNVQGAYTSGITATSVIVTSVRNNLNNTTVHWSAEGKYK